MKTGAAADQNSFSAPWARLRNGNTAIETGCTARRPDPVLLFARCRKRGRYAPFGKYPPSFIVRHNDSTIGLKLARSVTETVRRSLKLLHGKCFNVGAGLVWYRVGVNSRRPTLFRKTAIRPRDHRHRRAVAPAVLALAVLAQSS